ncbi:hypothetical protein L1S32_05905 [Methanogenium sp. S4BF]|uniref:hypothetical protein n=1 Tax=Methanogenium sp. S4BF TaxID=1789226 RepID=UPI002415F3D0|nr:hypothetical protein [Methanogenium sp. S4BF]WFN35732.1 hypothetical protein L1S32_05905 [Methanogenium sp. S4BF]
MNGRYAFLNSHRASDIRLGEDKTAYNKEKPNSVNSGRKKDKKSENEQQKIHECAFPDEEISHNFTLYTTLKTGINLLCAKRAAAQTGVLRRIQLLSANSTFRTFGSGGDHHSISFSEIDSRDNSDQDCLFTARMISIGSDANGSEKYA